MFDYTFNLNNVLLHNWQFQIKSASGINISCVDVVTSRIKVYVTISDTLV